MCHFQHMHLSQISQLDILCSKFKVQRFAAMSGACDTGSILIQRSWSKEIQLPHIDEEIRCHDTIEASCAPADSIFSTCRCQNGRISTQLHFSGTRQRGNAFPWKAVETWHCIRKAAGVQKNCGVQTAQIVSRDTDGTSLT